eukprot:TRINITY_DN120_c1_g1_i1.p1 TRINITY_DN120_c1_g1~~TRINITY_DN120_c1_g1_i1.p1  ORF type:complete len:530 (-),score=128.35 TRINITY_DN120_c1_g1_i1:713-2302(-)
MSLLSVLLENADNVPPLASQSTLVMVIPLLMLFALYTFINILHFWSRREFEPIKSRRPVLILLYITSIATHTIARNINREIGFSSAVSCGASMSIPLTLLALQNLMFVLRAVILHLDLILNQYSVQIYGTLKVTFCFLKEQKDNELVTGQSDNEQQQEQQIPFILRYRKHYNTKNMVLSILVLLVLQMFVVVIPLNGITEIAMASRNSAKCLEVQIYVGYAAFLTSMFELFIFVLIIVKIRRIEENFEIKRELVRSAVAFLISAVLQGVNAGMDLLPELMFANVFRFRGYQLFDVLFPMWYVIYRAIHLPTVMTYEWQESSGKLRDFSNMAPSQSCSIQDLLDLLNNIEGFSLFQEFLKKEFAVENLLFWNDVERFKFGTIKASEIFALYIDEDAPLRVEIPDHIRDSIKKEFKKVMKEEDVGARTRMKSMQKALLDQPHMDQLAKLPISSLESNKTLFSYAQTEVLRMMFQDPFTRFRQTPEYLQFRNPGNSKDGSPSPAAAVGHQQKKFQFRVTSSKSIMPQRSLLK